MLPPSVRRATDNYGALVGLDKSSWARWPGRLSTFRKSEQGWSGEDEFFQLATQPMFEHWNNEPLTADIRSLASAEQIMLFAVYITDGDITNGGVYQWLGNSSSCLLPSMVEGFALLGLPELADLLLAGAAEILPSGVPLDHEERLRVLDERLDASEEVDARVEEAVTKFEESYYSPPPSTGLGDNSEIHSVMCRWIDQHPKRFFAHVG